MDDFMEKRVAVNHEEDKPEIIIKDKLNKVSKVDNSLLNGDFTNFSKGWTAFDLDWWNVIETQVIDQNTSTIKIPIDKVKELFSSSRRHGSLKQFARATNDTFSKFLASQVRIERQEGNRTIYVNTNIFDQSYIDDKDLTFVVQVKKSALPYFNDISNWTRFALEQATSLHSTYSKRLFMYLKQWRTVGKRTFSRDEFTKKLDIPKTYQPGNIDQRIIKPALEDLAPYFFNLNVTKNYGKGKRGRKLIGYTFTWKPEGKSTKDVGRSKILDETTHMYSILHNPNLSLKSKFRAVDRYRNLKLGTTQKYYEEQHPNSYFIDPEDTKRSPRSMLHRADLEGLQAYTIDTLINLCIFYERLNKEGELKADDMADLVVIEKRLFDQHVKNIEKYPADAYDPEKRTIAGSLINNLDVKDHLKDYKSDSIVGEIRRYIEQEFAEFKQGQDNRPGIHDLD